MRKRENPQIVCNGPKGASFLRFSRREGKGEGQQKGVAFLISLINLVIPEKRLQNIIVTLVIILLLFRPF